MAAILAGLTPPMALSAELTISDGVVVKFGADAGLTVRDTLRTGSQTVFTSAQDDSVGGQIAATPGAPAAGDWRGVKLEASASGLSLDGLTLRYAGSSGSAGLELRKLSPTVRYLSVENSRLGVRVTDGAAPRFEGLSLVANGVGLEASGNAAPIVTGSDIHGNTVFGVQNLTPATVVQATGNWWGHTSGPKDLVGNPQGQGDAVSEGVNYGNYLAEIPLINPTLRVAGGMTYTEQPAITLELSCRNAVEYRLAEGGNFTGVAFQPMAAQAPFLLSAGDGVKQVSVQYRAATGNIVAATLPQGILYDTAGPTLSVTNPADGSYINNSIAITATASDPAGVAKLEFYINGTLVATDTAAPYSYHWDVTGAADGVYALKVIAYDAVGHTTTDNRTVTLAKAAPPPPDTEGPVLASLALSGSAIGAGSTLTRSGTLSVSASDRSGISRVEFLVDGVPIGTDNNGADGFTTYLDLYALTDGNHTLTVRAYDSLNNMSEQSTAIVVALAPPAAPTITGPTNGLVTNQTQVTVTGTAESQALVTIYNNGAAVGGPIAVDATGRFSISVTLADGSNRLQAAVSNRGGASPLSAEVQVTVDSSVPAAPLGLNAIAQTAGKIRLTWNSSLDSKVTGYHVYRSSVSFTNTSEAVRITNTPVPAGTTLYDDLPATDGTYYYRVVAVNSLGTQSAPSNEVSAVSDSTPPKALQIAYAPSGRTDPATGRIGVGRVDVVVTVSEPLVAVPFLSIVPQNGAPIAVDLVKSTDTEYRGYFTINPSTPSGTAYAVFSARDLVGNRGTDVVAGASLLIDAQGPNVTTLTVTPSAPIKNDSATPTTVTVTIGLSEAIKPGQAPQLSYVLSGAPATQVPIENLTQIGPLAWQGSFTLPGTAAAGQVEYLSFTYRGLDDLDNVSTTIVAANSFQVYQGDLPPLEAPLDFTGTAQPGGKVRLSWRAVPEAVGYQLYRQAPGESGLTAYQRLPASVEYLDTTTTDGIYQYTLASIRQANNQESLSAQTPVVQVAADSVAPGAPTNLALALTGSGIVATWSAPADGATSYNLYRSSAATITDVTGLTPIKTGIKQLSAIDPNPSLSEHTYAVTALDAAGNESPPSNSVYLNFALVPVNNLTVVLNEGALPVISWTHSGTTVAGYDVYLGPDATKTKLNLTPLTVTSYTDTGYANDERRYTIVAFDNNGAEIGRSIVLPKLSAQLVGGLPLKRGLMNRLQYQVSNQGETAVSGIRIKTKIGARENSSEPFGLAAGESKLVAVVVGGFADIPTPATVTTTTTIEVVPNEGEKVQIVRAQTVEVQDSALVLSVAPESLTRGASGKVRFTLENTSDVEIEIVTATQTGRAASGEIRYKLIDPDGNVLATQPFKQALGANVVTLATGQTVARLAPGAIFTSDPTDVPVPSAAPDRVTVQLEIDRYHYRLGSPETVSIPGQTTRAAATLVDTAYYAEVTSITPQSSFGDQGIVIQGRALARASAQPLPNVPVKLIFNVNGFERRADVVTDASGNFSYAYKPDTGGGVYRVSALHPDMLERPVHGQFVINSLVLQYASYTLTNPRNYPYTIKLRATAGEGTTATNVRFVYEAQYQPSGSLPPGLSVTPGAPITLGPKQSGELAVTVSGDNTAPESGTLILKVLADERGTTPVASLRVDWRFTNARPALYASPSYVETGLAQGGSVLEQVTLENRGFADAQGVTATLLNTDGTPAPSWIYLQSGTALGNIAIGEKRLLDLAVTPPATLAEGIYTFKLRIAAANAQGGDVPVYVSLTQSGVGNALFKVSDIYTGTLDPNGKRIPGLAGARITLQNESVISVTQTLTTDSFGEAYFTNLPAGRYKFRVTALNHQEAIGRLTIKPGVTATEDVFLDYNLVTVEWSVRETTIQDKYDIVLSATFETDVPAPVVLLEPLSVNLPSLKAGDVFYGELALTNYGLIRAENLRQSLPGADPYVRYEFLQEVPPTLEAKSRVTIPYRALALQDFEPSGAASGGGCFSYHAGTTITYDYLCANGTRRTGSASSHWYYTSGSSCGGSSSPVGGVGGVGGGGGGGGFFFGGGPSYSPLPGAACTPGSPCHSSCCIGNTSGGGL